MEQQSELKQRVQKLLNKNPKSMHAMAKEIGISRLCFVNFWKMNRDSHLKTLLIIENYLNQHEKEDGD